MNRANLIVIDPRFTRTAAHATEYVRIRPGTDIPIIWGMLWHIFQNGWEDKEFIRQRVYGMDEIRAEVAKWTPAEVERVTGVPGAQLRKVAETVRDAEARDADLVHGRDAEDRRHGECPRLFHPAAGHRQRRQGRHRAPTSSAATATCRARPTSASMSATLPAYYGLDENAWRHWSRVWGVSYEEHASRASTARQMMDDAGHPDHALLRRRDHAAEAQPGRSSATTLKAMVVFGHGGNTVTRMPEAVKGAREARPAGRRRPASDHLRGAVRPAQRHLPAADLHAVRMRRQPHRVEPLRPVGCEGRRTRSSRAAPTTR